eukprot:m.179484 g.179484  ORF g.179484 m.179484 type:complete len:247 (-) comp13569_c0_seq1:134-874(-)
MGQSLSLSSFWKNESVRVLMNGLDASGKTTVLYQMKLGKLIDVVPTVGFNVETIDTEGREVTFWDVGLRSGAKTLLYHYMHDTDVLLFVIDSHDKERIGEAKELLDLYLKMADEHCPIAPVGFLANKQDMPGSLSPKEVAVAFDLVNVMGSRQWTVIPCAGTTGEGLTDLLHWVVKVIANQKTREHLHKNIVRKVTLQSSSSSTNTPTQNDNIINKQDKNNNNNNTVSLEKEEEEEGEGDAKPEVA